MSSLPLLVVDDNQDAADSLAMLLTCWGHDAKTLYDGSSVLQTACSYHPAVILLDIAMPKINGFQLAQQIRQEPSLHGTILIAVTGFADQEHRSRWESAFDYFFVKPVEPDQLQKLLDILQQETRLVVESNAAAT